MDFSTPKRALISLTRRRPALDDEIVATAKTLLEAVVTNRQYLEGVETLLKSNEAADSRWEGLAVGILLATNALTTSGDSTEEKVYIDGPRVPTTEQSDGSAEVGVNADVKLTSDEVAQIANLLYGVCQTNLEHNEPRVRTFVAKAVGAYVTWSFSAGCTDASAADTRKVMFDRLVKSIEDHIEGGRDESKAEYSKSSAGALDDTTGWRALETNWQCLACWLSAMGGHFFEDDMASTQTYATLLKNCEFSAIVHLNRHVRAAGIAVLEQMVRSASSSPDYHQQLVDPTSALRKTLVTVLKTGLADNWSQVRMAASVLNRVFFTTLVQTINVPKENLQMLFTILLPRMCLNRFYLAQGVKLYSHETWRLIFPESGLQAVADTIAPICRYYVKMCDADNHVVREAACQAVAELAAKLGMDPELRTALEPHVPVLLQALIMCFHDESWPVRDEACVACGTFCRAYPDACRKDLDTLWTRWTEQLTDQIWSVRADAGVALADAYRAYAKEGMLEKILALIEELLPAAKIQPGMTKEEYKALQNNLDAHTDSQLYSCGSLAPKLRKKAGAGRIGCSSCDVTRPKQPWESTDGCLYLIRELVCLTAEDTWTPEDIGLSHRDDLWMKILAQVADVCRVAHFPQSDDLRATLWRQLPSIFRALGKQKTKQIYLEMFLDLLMRNLESRTASAISKHAAGLCAYEIAQLVGPSILRGRVMDDFQREELDRVLREKEMDVKHAKMQQQPGQKQFSPFEPPGLLDNIGKSPLHPGMGMMMIGGGADAAFQSNVQPSGIPTQEYPGARPAAPNGGGATQGLHPGVGDSFSL